MRRILKRTQRADAPVLAAAAALVAENKRAAAAAAAANGYAVPPNARPPAGVGLARAAAMTARAMFPGGGGGSAPIAPMITAPASPSPSSSSPPLSPRISAPESTATASSHTLLLPRSTDPAPAERTVASRQSSRQSSSPPPSVSSSLSSAPRLSTVEPAAASCSSSTSATATRAQIPMPTPCPVPTPTPCPVPTPTPVPAPVPLPCPTPCPTPAEIAALIAAQVALQLAAAAAAAEAAAAAAAAAAAQQAAEAAAVAAAALAAEQRRLACAAAKNARIDARTNERALAEAYRTCAWYQPMCSCNTTFYLVAGVAVFVAVTCAYFYWHAAFSDDPEVYVALYWHAFEAIVAALAFYLVMNAASDAYETQRATISDAAERELVQFLFGAWAVTARLVKQMFRDDTFICALPVPPVADENQRVFSEQIAAQRVFESIDVTVRLEAVQTPGSVHTWRSMFADSAILRAAWADGGRMQSAAVTTAFVDQNVFPRLDGRAHLPWPRVSLFARLSRNPILLVEFLVAIATLIFVVGYWMWAARRGPHATALGNTELFVSVFEAFYISAAVVAVAFETQTASDDAVFTYEHNIATSFTTLLIGAWPYAAPVYKSIYPCNRTIQTIRVPADVDQTLVALFNDGGCRNLFHTMSTSHKLVHPSSPERLRVWRGNFVSPIVREAWRYQRPDYVGEQGHFIEHELYEKAGCHPDFIPRAYRCRGGCCGLVR